MANMPATSYTEAEFKEMVEELRDYALAANINAYCVFAALSGKDPEKAKRLCEEKILDLNARRETLKSCLPAAPLSAAVKAAYKRAEALCDTAQALTEKFQNELKYATRGDIYTRLLMPDVAEHRELRRKAGPASAKPAFFNEKIFLAAQDDDFYALMLRLMLPIVAETSPASNFLNVVPLQIAYRAYAVDFLHPLFIAGLLDSLNVFDGKSINCKEYEQILKDTAVAPHIEEEVLTQFALMRDFHAQDGSAQEPTGSAAAKDTARPSLDEVNTLLDHINEMENEVTDELTGLYNLITSISKEPREKFTGACDNALLSSTLTSLRVDNLLSEYEHLFPRIIGAKEAVEDMKANITAAIAAFPVVREVDYRNRDSMIASLCSEEAFNNSVASRKSAGVGGMPVKAPFYNLRDHLDLIVSDETYRNFFFVTLWYFSSTVVNSDDVISLLAELYKDAHLSPQAIFSLLTLAHEQFLQLQKAYKNDPEYQTSVDLLAFRHEGWRLSASKEEQLECLSHFANRLALVFGA